MLDNYFNSRPKLPSIRQLAVSGATLAMWQGIFFKSCRRTPSVVRKFSGRQGLKHLEIPCDFREPWPKGTCRRVCEKTQRSSLVIAIHLGIASLLFSSGCGVSNATPSIGKTEVDTPAVEIDAGVIFSDRASYLCIPLSRFGLPSSNDIESIVCSCDCVKPSLAQYSVSSTTTANGVLIEFVPDEPSANTTAQPIHLGVELKLTMRGGQTQTFTINFLHTPSFSMIHPQC
jgi:hypothetical protein